MWSGARQTRGLDGNVSSFTSHFSQSCGGKRNQNTSKSRQHVSEAWQVCWELRCHDHSLISSPLVISLRALQALQILWFPACRARSLHLLSSQKHYKVMSIIAKYNIHQDFSTSTTNVPKQWQETTCFRKQS
jgi:hypothetical protein